MARQMPPAVSTTQKEEREQMEKEERKGRWKMWVWVVMTVLVLGGVVAIFGVLNWKDGEKKDNSTSQSRPPNKDRSSYPPAQSVGTTSVQAKTRTSFRCSNFPNASLLIVRLDITSVDPVGSSMRVQMGVEGCGDFLEGQGGAVDGGDDGGGGYDGAIVGNGRSLGVPVDIAFDTFRMHINPFTPIPSQDLTLTFASGDVNNYPFDRYQSNFIRIAATTTELPKSLQGILGPNTTATAIERRQAAPVETTSVSVPKGLNQTVLQQQQEEKLRDLGVGRVPMAVFVDAALLTYTITVPENVDITEKGDGTIVSVQIDVRRSFVTRLFSLFVMAVMWLLSVVTLGLALTPWMVWKKVEPPAIGFGLALLFALPAIRNAQPGIPPIGCTSDVVSFFWSMMLAASAASIMMLSYIVFSNRLDTALLEVSRELKENLLLGGAHQQHQHQQHKF
ncbi:hypothetical protein HDU97_005250 [Phlyctochytrium planicorne]|nr:hypothetical protein HDU97_005250 [Phlyctochytrium planicorne]